MVVYLRHLACPQGQFCRLVLAMRRSVKARIVPKKGKYEHWKSVSALGFPSKTTAEIAPDHPKLSEGAFAPRSEDNAETRITIALCRH